MKKYLLSLIILLMPVMAWAAGSSTSLDYDVSFQRYGYGRLRVLTISFTADDTNGSIPDLTLNEDTTNIKKPLLGWNLFEVQIDCNHTGTEPTENSEIYIYQNGIDLLQGAGVNMVDNSVERIINTTSRPVYTTLTVTITQQSTATNDATGTVYLLFNDAGAVDNSATWATSEVSTEQTTDAAVLTGKGLFGGFTLATDGTNDVTIDIYDNTAGSGKNLIPTMVLSASSRVHAYSVEPPIPVDNGIYVDITCSGTISYTVCMKDLD